MQQRATTPLYGKKEKKDLKTNNFSTDKLSLSLSLSRSFLKNKEQERRSNGTADRNMEARIPTTKYGLRKRYRWVCPLYINIMAKRRRRRRGRSGRRRRRRGARRGEETGISGWLVGHRPTVYTRTVRSVARVQDHNAISTVGSNCRGRERAYFA